MMSSRTYVSNVGKAASSVPVTVVLVVLSVPAADKGGVLCSNVPTFGVTYSL